MILSSLLSLAIPFLTAAAAPVEGNWGIRFLVINVDFRFNAAGLFEEKYTFDGETIYQSTSNYVVDESVTPHRLTSQVTDVAIGDTDNDEIPDVGEELRCIYDVNALSLKLSCNIGPDDYPTDFTSGKHFHNELIKLN